jgi:hypothetical protein
MILVLLVGVLAGLPLVFLDSFGKLVVLSTYLGLAHLLILLGICALIWFGIRQKALFRVWQRRRH